MEGLAKAQLHPGIKLLLVALALIAPLLGIRRVAHSFSDPSIYKKDFLQDYVFAKALQNGVDPYLPVSELTQRWLPEHNVTNLRHPTSHTLAIGWLCYPLGWFSYETAARLWCGFELVLLGIAIKLLFGGMNWPLTKQRWFLAFWVALGWMPVIENLWTGQYNLLLLVLWLGSWRLLRQGKDLAGGATLGGMMVLKLVGWPLILWLAWQRRWRGVIAAAVTISLWHALAIALHGWPMVRDYYFQHGPLVSHLYRTWDLNFSLMTLGERLFAPFGRNYLAPPLWPAPLLAKLTGLTLCLLVLGLALYGARQLKCFDAGFALLMSISLLLNPIAWIHYFVALCLTLALLLERLQQMDWPRHWTRRLIVAFAPLCLPIWCWSALGLFFGSSNFDDPRPLVPFWAPWLSAVPLYAVMGLSWLLWRLQREAESKATASIRPTRESLSSLPTPLSLPG